MRTMLKTMSERLSAGEELILVTVTAASGATPRGAGARMLVNREGRICGTIGGGAVEFRAIQMAQQLLQERNSGQHDFSLTRNDVEDLGMICGGDVRVFFRYLPSRDENALAVTAEALRQYSLGRTLWLLDDLDEGGCLGLWTREEGFFGLEGPLWLTEELTRRPHRVQREGRDFFVEQINAAGRVYIFGGGHVAQELEPVLSHVGFRCVVLDDRPEFTRRELFPTAEEIRLVDFNRLSDFVTLGEEDYVCVMTRGHAYDTAVQAQILRQKPAYVGVIGSRAKAAGVRKRLLEEFGLTEAEVNRITTPIGLAIQAETPAEIAISIAAQLIQVRANRNR